MREYRLKPSDLAALRTAHRSVRERREAYRLNAVILQGQGRRAADVARAIEQQWGVKCSVGGMTRLLRWMGYRYNKPALQPGKQHPPRAVQGAFVAQYTALRTTLPRELGDPFQGRDAPAARSRAGLWLDQAWQASSDPEQHRAGAVEHQRCAGHCYEAVDFTFR